MNLIVVALITMPIVWFIIAKLKFPTWICVMLMLVTLSICHFFIHKQVIRNYNKLSRSTNSELIPNLRSKGADKQVDEALKKQQEYIRKHGKLDAETNLLKDLRKIQQDLE